MASLRVRMAASYVLVTIAAVLVVEAVTLALVLPKILDGSGAADTVREQAERDARLIGAAAARIYQSGQATEPGQILRLAAKEVGSGTALSGTTSVPGMKIFKPEGDAAVRAEGAMPLAALVDLDGSIVTSSAPDKYPKGTRAPAPMLKALSAGGSARSEADGRVWALNLVILKSPPSRVPVEPKARDELGPGKGIQALGAFYVQMPEGAVNVDTFGAARPFAFGGAVVLLLVVPVGVVFGLLSTRRMIRRVHRVADMTASVAAGDFRSRVAVTRGDEIGRLEDSVNRMAEQLGSAVDTERRLAGAGARQAERARIARELHDSISQDLFSLSLLAGGLRRALPEEDRLRTQAEAMERTAGRTMREMQAMLLELRPVALEDAGLVPALEELCRAYETRLGIKVVADLAKVRLDPPAEHAVLRVTQEALGNAVRHANPETIDVRLANGAANVTLEIRDDGRGFDPAGVHDRHGMGLGLMRERVAELGGAFEVISCPGEGTSVRVRLPARPA